MAKFITSHLIPKILGPQKKWMKYIVNENKRKNMPIY